MSTLSSKQVAQSAIEGHVYKVFPNDLNAHGTAFGGMILSKCDRLALVAAERHSGHVCVTASVDSVHFMAPAKENDTLIFSVAINRAWRTSMEVGIKVVAENSYSGEHKHILSAYFTFVALDKNDKPTTIPTLSPLTDDEKRRYEEAQIRREARLNTVNTLKNHRI